MPSEIRIEFAEHGGPEVLHVVDRDTPVPGEGEIRVRHTAIGVNFIDTYHRTGLYRVPDLPSGIGVEGAGIVEACGPGVDFPAVGERVAYCGGGPLGAYASSYVVKADRAVRLPDFLSDRDAAAVMLKGLTVQYLIRQIHRVKAGETVLFHAAAGGVGLIAMQWLRSLGVTVIGTAGSEEKAELARQHGCTHVILYRNEDIPTRVRELTDGAGVPVVYDSVGKDTFEASLDCLAPRGLMVTFGNASGPVPSFSPGILSEKGSLMLTRPTLFHFVATREELDDATGDLFAVLQSGEVKPVLNEALPLREARRAHELLESRRTTGSTLLIPD